MSHLENGPKVTVLTQSAKFFLPDTLKVTGSTISTPKSYDEHPRQVKYGSPPPGISLPHIRMLRFYTEDTAAYTQYLLEVSKML